MPEGLRIFLDSNILFSATHKPNHDFSPILDHTGDRCDDLTLCGGRHGEIAKNQAQSQRREILLEPTVIVSDVPHDALLPGIDLPARDRPILAAAIDAGADPLITGDEDHFCRWMNRAIKTRHGSIMIMRPRPFLD